MVMLGYKRKIMNIKRQAVPIIRQARTLLKSRKISASLVVLVFALVGVIWLSTSNAATYVVAIEAESGTITGIASATSGSPAGASGKIVAFGSGTGGVDGTNPPPPPPPAPGAFSGPLKVGAGGHHLADQNNKQFMYAGDTAWTLLTKLSVANAKQYIDLRKAQGFNVILTNIVAFPRTQSGPHGTPFQGGNLDQPIESYFVAIDQILAHAESQGMVLHIGTLWTGDNGGKWGGSLPPMNQFQSYGTYLGNRYKNAKNLVWFVGGDDTPYRNMSSISTMANALKAADPNHLITYHTDSKAYDQSGQSWLGFNSFQWNSNSPPYTYADVRQGYGYNKPVLDMEPAYDPKACCGSDQDTSEQENRRNGWWAVLAGALGVVYGGPQETWNVGNNGDQVPTAAINRNAARHTGNIRKILEPLNWHLLQPDWDNQTVTGGRGSYGGTNYVTAGRASDGSLIVAYIPQGGSLTVNLTKLSGPATAQWYDPTTGNTAGTATAVTNSGSQTFNTPGNSDHVLVIKR